MSARARHRRAFPPVNICIGCGCDEMHACVVDDPIGWDAPRGCTWLVLDKRARRGVCERCPSVLAQFKGGERELSMRARRRQVRIQRRGEQQGQRAR